MTVSRPRLTGVIPEDIHQEEPILNAMHTLQQMSIVAILSLMVAVMPAFMGAGYALWPTEAKLTLMRPLSLAGIFGALAGFVLGLINVLMFAIVKEAPLTSPSILALGAAESLVPLFVAFVSLTLAWLFVAVGLRRTA